MTPAEETLLRRSEESERQMEAMREAARFGGGHGVLERPPLRSHGPERKPQRRCRFVTDGIDCQDCAVDGHTWCQYHAEANWLRDQQDVPSEAVWGWAVKHYPTCYRFELSRGGPEEVQRVMDVWHEYKGRTK